MLELKNPRQIIIVFAIFALIFFLYSDSIVRSVSSMDPVSILIITVLLNPVYLLLIWGLNKTYGIRGAISGFLIATASDLISIPHILQADGTYSQASFNLVTDSSFEKFIPAFLKFTITLPVIGPVNFSVLLVYVVISIGLVILALMLAKQKRFKQIFMESI